MQDVDAEGKDRKRPPWVGPADRQQRLERADGRSEDPDEPAVASASEQRGAGGELDDADDDGDPSPGMQARERVLGVVEEMGVADRRDAVNEVEDARDQ